MFVRYSLTYPEFLASVRLARRRSPGLLAIFIAKVWILPALGLAGGVFLLGDVALLFRKQEVWFSALLAAIGVFGCLLPLVHPWRMRRLFRSRRAVLAGGEEEFELTPNEVISRSPGHSEGRILAAAIVAFAENETVAQMYMSRTLFLTVPKRALTVAEQAELRNWMHLRSEATPKC